MPFTSVANLFADAEPNLAQALLARLVNSAVIAPEAWDAISPGDREALEKTTSLAHLADRLAAHQLLTAYQVARLRAGAVNGLILGNYRVLEKIGAGGMGVVFRAEHRSLRTPVAIKALYVDGKIPRPGIDRFFLEVRTVASLKHPNLVAAIDAGEEPAAGPDGQAVPYLVMEFVPGRNLQDLVSAEGPLPIATACQYLHQIADALTEAHRHGLVHRDIKPSNILITPNGQAKLLDFGVARIPTNEERLTNDGAHVGTLGYMAPEQAKDPREVDARADIFGLAATLVYALTGHEPFPNGTMNTRTVPQLSSYRADVPPELETVLERLMAFDPDQRISTASAAMRELAPFLGWVTPGTINRTPLPSQRRPGSGTIPPPANRTSDTSNSRTYRILIVDDEEPIRRVCRLALQNEPVVCEEAGTGTDAVAQALTQPFDLILLDVDLPGANGEVVLRRLRKQPPTPHLKVLMLSGRSSGDDLSRFLTAGADDYLTKPFSVVQLRARVKAALRLKEAQDRSDLLTTRLAGSNAELERALTLRAGELVHARGALVLALAKLVEQRSSETGAHLLRLQRYCRVLAEAAARTPAFADRLEPTFVQTVESAAPLHDIGKVAIPDHILNKPGRLTPEERLTMQQHTTAGADTLAEVSARYPFATGFLHTATEIARHHHEKWDGSGYPDQLAGEAIPLSARLVTVADVYDALRSRRVYKPGFSHEETVDIMLNQSPGHFDPALLVVFRLVALQFDRVFRDAAD